MIIKNIAASLFGKQTSEKQNAENQLHENDIKILKQLNTDLFLTTQEIQERILPDISLKFIENGVNDLYNAGYLGRVIREHQYAYYLEDKGEEVVKKDYR